METQTKIIKYNNKDVSITQFLSESDEQFEARLELITKLEQDNIEWKEALKMSKIYSNIKFKKCKYSPQVYYSIKKWL